QRHQDVDHQRLDRRRGRGVGADRRGRARLRRAHRHPRLLGAGDQGQAVAARLGHLRTGARRRPPARLGGAAEGRGPARPAHRAERGPLRHHLRRAGRCPRLPGDRHRVRAVARGLRQAALVLPADPGQARRHGARTGQGPPARLPPRPHQGTPRDHTRADQHRQAQQYARDHRHRPRMPHHPGRQRHHPRVPGDPPRQQPGIGADLRGHLRDAPAVHRQGAHRPGGLPVTGALDGLVIADFGRVLAGPYATMLLADLGAEVVKIERPGAGDDTRHWGPPWSGDESTYFLGVNRNKRSAALDLSDPADLDAARALAARADVLVENFLPGTLDRLGLGYEQVRALNPDIVYCSITGFGRDNALPGYDLLIQAVGGLMSITGPDPGTPTKVGVAVVDVITGMHAALGILAALRHRDRTGEGQRVEVDLLSSLLSALANQTSAYVGAGVVPVAMGNRHPSIAPYEVFRAADRPLILAVGN